jgi:tRNA G18 (ribose-2'-O)-methylase SpoU
MNFLTSRGLYNSRCMLRCTYSRKYTSISITGSAVQTTNCTVGSPFNLSATTETLSRRLTHPIRTGISTRSYTAAAVASAQTPHYLNLTTIVYTPSCRLYSTNEVNHRPSANKAHTVSDSVSVSQRRRRGPKKPKTRQAQRQGAGTDSGSQSSTTRHRRHETTSDFTSSGSKHTRDHHNRDNHRRHHRRRLTHDHAIGSDNEYHGRRQTFTHRQGDDSDTYRDRGRDRDRQHHHHHRYHRRGHDSHGTYNRRTSRYNNDSGPSIRKWDAIGEYLYGSHAVLAALTASTDALAATMTYTSPSESATTVTSAQDDDETDGTIPHRRSAHHRVYLLDRSLGLKGGVEADIVTSIERLAMDLNIPVDWVTRQELNIMSGNRPHNGVVLDTEPLTLPQVEDQLPWQLTPSSANHHGMTTQQLLRNVWVVCDEVVDPQNLGAILRSCYFFGVAGVIINTRNCAPLASTACKASSGATEYLNLWSCNSTPRLLRRCTSDSDAEPNNSRIAPVPVPGPAASVVSLTLAPDSVSPAQLFENSTVTASQDHEPDGPRRNVAGRRTCNAGPGPGPVLPSDRPVVFVVGNEGAGLRAMVERECEYSVHIPSCQPSVSVGIVDSLNVSNAIAVMLYEAQRMTMVSHNGGDGPGGDGLGGDGLGGDGLGGDGPGGDDTTRA